jgi:hypothetical protein
VPAYPARGEPRSLCVLLLLATVALAAFAVAVTATWGERRRVEARYRRVLRRAELAGWFACERALAEELEPDSDLLARVRTRVPARLRLAHEEAVLAHEDPDRLTA